MRLWDRTMWAAIAPLGRGTSVQAAWRLRAGRDKQRRLTMYWEGRYTRLAGTLVLLAPAAAHTQAQPKRACRQLHVCF